MNTFHYTGSYLPSTSKKPPIGVHPFKCKKALGRLAVFAQNIHICVSAIEIRIVRRSSMLREQAKRNLGSDRAHSQNPQFANPNPSSSSTKLILMMPSQEEEMFMTESSLVSSLHDTMAMGEQQNGGRRCGGVGGEELSEERRTE